MQCAKKTQCNCANEMQCVKVKCNVHNKMYNVQIIPAHNKQTHCQSTFLKKNLDD